ncbi:hypothetical protein [Phenylobacterium sp.]|uniref:hypothetical protein n=1 Tax=Phenylobacterium sp. TaxID=1871053 RepID=UPI002F417EA8
MPTPPPNAPYWTYMIPLVALALVILRSRRARRLRIETLWIMPVVILALVGLSFSQQATPSPLMLAAYITALAIGALLGWWRARFTHITVDRATHQLTSQASPLGVLLILAIFALRYGIRMFASENASAMHVSVNAVADVALIITVGLVCAQRLEIALRASRLLNEAKAGATSA